MYLKYFSYGIVLLLMLPAVSSEGCTVFYISRDGRVLGGSNEDWKDPNTKMWFYPAGDDHHGWIKFGFAGGFPQAGMNDSGIFWDGTAGPYQDMPFSLENKEKLSMPLMQKVMEECGSIHEAICIFDGYYCDDQYRGQYLVGGPDNTSVIIDGDYLHQNDCSCQVLTNFHRSNPELGGYPCWRYQKASEMLDSCSSPTHALIGSILSATHQEGEYPTQYSLIFDPVEKTIFLFYYHNFHEYLELNLNECLSADTISYAIPPLFSRTELLYPEQHAEIHADAVVLKWKGLPGSNYEVTLTDEQGAIAYSEKATAETDPGNPHQPLYVVLLLLPVLPVLQKKRVYLSVFLIMCFLICYSCKKEDEIVYTDTRMEFRHSVLNLEAGRTYYWRITATPDNTSSFHTESIAYSFTCTGF